MVREIVDIFVMIVWHHDHVARIIFDPKRIDESGDELVDVDDVLELEECFVTFYPTHPETDGTNIVDGCVVVYDFLFPYDWFADISASYVSLKLPPNNPKRFGWER